MLGRRSPLSREGIIPPEQQDDCQMQEHRDRHGTREQAPAIDRVCAAGMPRRNCRCGASRPRRSFPDAPRPRAVGRPKRRTPARSSAMATYPITRGYTAGRSCRAIIGTFDLPDVVSTSWRFALHCGRLVQTFQAGTDTVANGLWWMLVCDSTGHGSETRQSRQGPDRSEAVHRMKRAVDWRLEPCPRSRFLPVRLQRDGSGSCEA